MSEKTRKILKLLLLKRTITKNRRRCWVHPINQNRTLNGEHLKLDEMFYKYPDKFRGYMRMMPSTFQKLLSVVGPTLKKQNTNWRDAISEKIRLYVILRLIFYIILLLNTKHKV